MVLTVLRSTSGGRRDRKSTGAGAGSWSGNSGTILDTHTNTHEHIIRSLSLNQKPGEKQTSQLWVSAGFSQLCCVHCHYPGSSGTALSRASSTTSGMSPSAGTGLETVDLPIHTQAHNKRDSTRTLHMSYCVTYPSLSDESMGDISRDTSLWSEASSGSVPMPGQTHTRLRTLHWLIMIPWRLALTFNHKRYMPSPDLWPLPHSCERTSHFSLCQHTEDNNFSQTQTSCFQSTSLNLIFVCFSVAPVVKLERLDTVLWFSLPEISNISSSAKSLGTCIHTETYTVIHLVTFHIFSLHVNSSQLSTLPPDK